MKEHQRFFPVVDAQGNLMPGFITVRSGNAEHLDIVRAGNEKVLRARLDDSAFFWNEDQKTPLAAQTDKLAKIVFLEKLGTVKDRVERLEGLTSWLAEHLDVASEVMTRAQRAAGLAKSDLVTLMVYEFPELQGIMGQKYALLSGEDTSVAQAIREHYQPRFAGDALPQTPEGTLVALADKIDAITGCFAAGIIPTGSQDPYALRRQAQAICLIAMEGVLPLVLPDLVEQSYNLYQQKFQLEKTLNQVQTDVREFFKQRLRFLLTEAGVSYDVIDAVLAAGIDQPADVGKRALALAAFRKQEDLGALLTAYTRAANLAQKSQGGKVREEFLHEPSEQALWAGIQQSRQRIKAAGDDYAAVFQVMADLRPAVDFFFDAVMVMAEDLDLRQTRLALLADVVGLMDGIADLSKIVE
jgi:glycyl-tRNA synthetase beta chain